MKSVLVVTLLVVATSARADDIIRAGGLLQLDGRFFVDDGAEPLVDQFTTRSLRPELNAKLDQVEARLVPDFAGGKLVVQDAYIDFEYIPGVTLRVGKTKVPFGLERLQQEGTPMFVERGLPTQIAPNRDVGAILYGEIARAVAWQVGIMNGIPDGVIGDTDISNQKDGVARVFVQPFPCVHAGLGGAATYGYDHGSVASPELAQYKTEGLNSFVSFPAGTTLANTAIAQGQRWRATAQGYWFQGPFGALAEYVRSSQEAELGQVRADIVADAWQAEAQWVVTGEDSTYANVRPRTTFDPDKDQWGAFDVVARYDELRVGDSAFSSHLLDPSKAARRARGYALGVDWFPNAHVRATVDVERTMFRLGFAGMTDRPDETVITARAQVAF